MNHQIELVPATDKDKSAVFNTHHSAYKEMVIRQFGGWDSDLQNRFIQSDWDKGGIELIYHNNQYCGYIMSHIEDDFIRVSNFAILPMFQEKGIGAAVVAIFKERCVGSNYKLRMDAFLTNTRAQSFYLAHGFKIIGKSKTHNLNEWKPETTD